jgi:hypothetical protein
MQIDRNTLLASAVFVAAIRKEELPQGNTGVFKKMR